MGDDAGALVPVSPAAEEPSAAAGGGTKVADDDDPPHEASKKTRLIGLPWRKKGASSSSSSSSTAPAPAPAPAASSKPASVEKAVPTAIRRSRVTTFYSDYTEKKQRAKMEQMKRDAWLAERLEQLRERESMEVEERRSWDTLALPWRNLSRLRAVEVRRVARAAVFEVAEARRVKAAQEEGFTSHNLVLQQFTRWRDSPASHRTYAGHAAEVFAVIVSNDALLSASADCTLRVWHLRTGKCLRTLEGHGKAVRDCDLSPGFALSSSSLSSSSSKKKSNADDDDKRRANHHDTNHLGLACSGSIDKTVRLWDARSGRLLRTLKGHTDVVYATKFRPDGLAICSSSADCTFRIWDALEGHLIYAYVGGHDSAVVSVAFSTSGRYLASASDFGERMIKVWDARMPGAKRHRTVVQRVQWTQAGLMFRFVLVLEPPQGLLQGQGGAPKKSRRGFLATDEPKSARHWDQISDGEDEVEDAPKEEEEEERKKKGEEDVVKGAAPHVTVDTDKYDAEKMAEKADQRDRERFLKEADRPTSGGFALSVATVDRATRRTTLVTSYHGGQSLRLVLRGTNDNKMSSFFLSASAKLVQRDADVAGSGARCGLFALKKGTDDDGDDDDKKKKKKEPSKSPSTPATARTVRATCDRTAVHSNDRTFEPTSEVLLDWTAPPKGTGQVVLRCALRAAGEDAASLLALSYSLQEEPPPPKRRQQAPGGSSSANHHLADVAGSPLLSTEELQHRMRLYPFKASELHQRFIDLLRNGDLVEAEAMVTPDVRLKIKSKGLRPDAPSELLRGRAEVMDRLRHYAANGCSILKDAKDLEPGKSSCVILHGEALDDPESSTDESADENENNRPAPPTMETHRIVEAEMKRVRHLRQSGLACADEVRSLWTPAVSVADLEALEAERKKTQDVTDHMIINGKYGGDLVHLQMVLPANYPSNVATMNAEESEARKGAAAMKTADEADNKAKKAAEAAAKKKETTADLWWAEKKSERRALAAALAAFAERKKLAQRHEASRRRHAHVQLPGFEMLDADLGTTELVRASADIAAGHAVYLFPDKRNSKELIDLRRRLLEKKNPRKRWLTNVGGAYLRAGSTRLLGASSRALIPSSRVLYVDNNGASLRSSSSSSALRGSMMSPPSHQRPGSSSLATPNESSRALALSPQSARSGEDRSAPTRVRPTLLRLNILSPDGGDQPSVMRATTGRGGPNPPLLLQRGQSSLASNSSLALSSKKAEGDDVGRMHKEKKKKKKVEARLRRRNSFATLPGFDGKPKDVLKAQRREARARERARLRGGCLLTFKVAEGLVRAHHHTTNEVTWSQDEKRVASCSSDRTIKLWEPETGRCIRTLVGHGDAVMGCGFSEDGLRLVSCGMDNVIILWNTVSGAALRTLHGHDDAVHRVRFLNNGSQLVSCSSDRTLKMWNLTPQEPDAPPKPTVEAKGRFGCVVHWKAPPAYNEDLTAYHIEHRLGLREAFGGLVTVDGTTYAKTLVGSLRAGQNYQFRVRAVNRMGCGAWSEPSAQHVTDVDVPEALEQPVVIVSQGAATPRSLSLAWHAPTVTVEGTAIQRFKVEGEGPGNRFGSSSSSSSSSSLGGGLFRVLSWKEGLLCAEDLRPALEAQLERDARRVAETGPATRGVLPHVDFDEEIPRILTDKEEEASEPIPPDVLAAQRRDVDRRNAWKKRAALQDLVDRRRAEKLAYLDKSTRGILIMATVDGLNPGTEYRFRVAAVSAVGEGPFSPPTFSVRTPPDRPSRPAPPVAIARDRTSIEVTWVPPNENGSAIERYEVRRADLVDVPPVDLTRFRSALLFEGLKPGKKYAFVVRAANREGPSDWSDPSPPATTLTGPPEAPPRPQIDAVRITSLDLSCFKPASNGKMITTILVQRRELRRGGLKTDWSSNAAFAAPAGPAGSHCALRLRHLPPATVFQVRIAMKNDHGPSPWSLPSFRAQTLRPEVPWKVEWVRKQHNGRTKKTTHNDNAADLVWCDADARGSPVLGHVLRIKRLKRRQPAQQPPTTPPEPESESESPPPRTVVEVDDQGAIVGVAEEEKQEKQEAPFDPETAEGTQRTLDIGYRSYYRAEALEPEARYVFQVAATNNVGTGPFSDWSEVFTRDSEVPTPPRDPNRKRLSSPPGVFARQIVASASE